MNVSTIINYSSLDRSFIKPNILESLKFSDEIIICTYDKLFDNTPENLNDLNIIASLSKKVKILILPFVTNTEPRELHNQARWIGMQHSRNEFNLFLDADEIADGLKMKNFLESIIPFETDAYIFSCYWYFREPIYQALEKEYCGLLANKTRLKKDYMFTNLERWGIRYDKELTIHSNVSIDNPLIHHYSWVRNKEAMLAKVKNWGHKSDRDWTSAVTSEFEHPFSGRDFVHGYRYRTVDNTFDIKV
jgi:hypothetical protein